MKRREMLKGAAWAVPILAVSAVAPNAAASPPTCESRVYEYDPRTTTLDKGKNDSAKVTVATGSHFRVEFIKRQGHLHVNLKVSGKTQNYHYAREVPAGEVFIYPLERCQDADWIQVAGNNVHYYGGGVFQ